MKANEKRRAGTADSPIATDPLGGVHSSDEVLELLAPLTAAYTRRAEPGQAPATAGPVPGPPGAPAQAFIPCHVDGVLTIDSERRVLWPDVCGRTGQGCAGLRARNGAIEVSFDASPGTHVRALDQRGRLRLPLGVLRASGLQVGDRVVIARSEAAGPLLLVRADRVGIDLDVA